VTEKEISAIIKVVTDYFLSVSDKPARMGIPYMKDSRTKTFPYTAVIGISGTRKGGVFFTSDRPLLEAFGGYILGETDFDEDSIYDLVGEMTNVIAGNLRETFGSGFLISVPIIMRGEIDDISVRLKPPVLIIPIEWNNYKALLAIGLE